MRLGLIFEYRIYTVFQKTVHPFGFHYN